MSQTNTYNRATETVRATVSDSRKLSGVCFFVLSAQFMTAIMLAAAMASDYDFSGGAISDLGVFAETALLFNASLVVVGVLNLLGGFLFYRAHGKRWLLAVFTLVSIGAVGAGMFPLDTGGLHSLFALFAFLFFNVQAVGSATQLAGLMKVIAALAGVVGLAFVVIMVIGDAGNPAIFGPIGHGGAERMIVYPVMLWMVAFGGSLLGAPARRDSVQRGE